MEAKTLYVGHNGDTPTDENIFALIADDIEQKGYSIRHGALPIHLSNALLEHHHSLSQDEQDLTGIKVAPLHSSIVIFLSEEFPHEVLPAASDRYSVAGWFRVNGSIDNRIDPPR